MPHQQSHICRSNFHPQTVIDSSTSKCQLVMHVRIPTIVKLQHGQNLKLHAHRGCDLIQQLSKPCWLVHFHNSPHCGFAMGNHLVDCKHHKTSSVEICCATDDHCSALHKQLSNTKPCMFEGSKVSCVMATNQLHRSLSKPISMQRQQIHQFSHHQQTAKHKCWSRWQQYARSASRYTASTTPHPAPPKLCHPHC